MYWTNFQCYLKIPQISDLVVGTTAMARARGGSAQHRDHCCFFVLVANFNASRHEHFKRQHVTLHKYLKGFIVLHTLFKSV